MLNSVTLQGRLTRDPEILRTQSGTSGAAFTLAVEQDLKNKNTGVRDTDFINIVAWGNTADFVNRYFGKGRMALVEGRLHVKKWVDNDGRNRQNMEVIANRVYFGDTKRDGDGGAPRPAASPLPDIGGEYEELMEDDGKLPW